MAFRARHPLSGSVYGPHIAARRARDLAGPADHRPDRTLAIMLLNAGLVPGHAMVGALSRQAAEGGRLIDILLSQRLVAEAALYAALARRAGAGRADLHRTAPDIRLIARLGAVTCLAEGVLPWRRQGGATVIATAYPDDFARHRAKLTAEFGPVVMALASPREIETAILRAKGPQMARKAEQRVAEPLSCRRFQTTTAPLLGVAVLVLATLALLAPAALLAALTVWTVVLLVLTMLVRGAALLLTLRPAPAAEAPVEIARLPVVSVMVALYKESDIAARLVRRLGRLDYPRELLDIVLVVEEEDRMTRAALLAADLPPWMRIVVAPEGTVKTKPRALNYALDHCRGTIIGVYDAEDAPEPDQLRLVVDRFFRRGPEVACLQGVLDFYNPRSNWLARCFTVEYASWFRVILPGLQHLGFPIPLGGTTLFFRRAALESLGGWDAHNVTEDADLGMRLARRGMRTELIATTTMEEANCRTLPWIKQRSRWIKGYMLTYATHMRRPLTTYREMGAWQFTGFQILFLGSLTQTLMVPLLWSFWLLSFGLPHPVTAFFPPWLCQATFVLFVLCEVLNISIGLTGLSRSGQKISALWVPTLSLYHPLAALGSYKAAWELMRSPFYWDKTSHGLFDGAEGEAEAEKPVWAGVATARPAATESGAAESGAAESGAKAGVATTGAAPAKKTARAPTPVFSGAASDQSRSQLLARHRASAHRAVAAK